MKTNEITASPRHPHEPSIPPAFDDSGGCLVCQLLVQIEKGRQWNQLLELELTNLRMLHEPCDQRIAELAAALAKAEGGAK